MVKTDTIINKETGKPYVSKEGKELVEHRLQESDEFIPKFTTPRVDSTGEYPRYTIVAVCRDKETKEEYQYDGTSEIFITLTPAQYKTLKEDAENGVAINQTSYRCYKAHSEEYNKDFIAVSSKEYKPAITFEEVDSFKDNKTEE